MTHQEFKAGDKVVCVETSGGGKLRRGTEYIVKRVFSGTIAVEGLGGAYYKRRFRLVEDRKGDFKVGDRVVITNAEPQWWFKNGDVGVIESVNGYLGSLPIVVRIDGRPDKGGAYLSADRIAYETPKEPKRQPIKSVKVDQQDVLAVLSAYVKDTLGIDASVSKIVDCYPKAVELVLKAEAA